MSFMNLQKNREGNLMASFKMSCFDLSHRIENMVQIVETIKLTVEETEWNKLEYFDSLYNKRYRF